MAERPGGPRGVCDLIILRRGVQGLMTDQVLSLFRMVNKELEPCSFCGVSKQSCTNLVMFDEKNSDIFFNSFVFVNDTNQRVINWCSD